MIDILHQVTVKIYTEAPSLLTKYKNDNTKSVNTSSLDAPEDPVTFQKSLVKVLFSC